MKPFYTLIILFFVGTGIARCQADQTANTPPPVLNNYSGSVIPDVTNNYSLTVVAKVTDVVLAANIAQAEQVTLANFFQNEATSLANAINGNATPQQIQAVQAQLVTQFQAILSPQELAVYSINRRTSVYALPQPQTTEQH